MSLSSTKSIASLQVEASSTDSGSLRRVLTATNLTMLGIGAIIGAGIFVLTGTAAATNAGPGDSPVIRLCLLRVSVRGRVLRRVRLDDPDRGQCVHVRLRHARANSLPGSLAGILILEYLFGAATVAVGMVGPSDRLSERRGCTIARGVHGGAAHLESGHAHH